MLTPISATTGVIWPALPSPLNSTILALLYQLDQSQWEPLNLVEKQQWKQLTVLLIHAYQTVPFYRDRLDILLNVHDNLVTYEHLRQVPILKRSDIQTNFEALVSRNLPKAHLPISDSYTSGSTGRPVCFKTTKVKGLLLRALNLRNHLWHQHNLRAKVAAIRVPRSRWENGQGEGKPRENQKPHQWTNVFPSGIIADLDSGTPITDQLRWLQNEDPQHILTYPTNLASLAQAAKVKRIALPSLKRVSTFGEVLHPDTRKLCHEVWGISITDTYGCSEIGPIALQCPKHDHYHTQETVIVEVLDDNDQPCHPGQVGRVVLTDLHNYAMPLIRYEIGDYAEVGEPCSCGRTLPVLKRVLGRTRNMLVLPSGDKVWPSFVLSNWVKIAPITQIQVIQHTKTDMEVKLVPTGPVDASTESRLYDRITQDVGNHFQIRLTYVDEIPRSPSGKFEDFISKVTS